MLVSQNGDHESPYYKEPQEPSSSSSSPVPLLSTEQYLRLSNIGHSKEAFPGFSGDIEPSQYPWIQLHYGHYRRHLLEAGYGWASRPIAAGHEATEIQRVVHEASMVIPKSQGAAGRSGTDCIGGRLRYLPGLGVEYEVYLRDRVARNSVEMPSSDANSDDFDSKPVLTHHKVLLQRPMGDLEVEYVGRTSSQLVHIILPYYNRLEALERFLTRFVQMAQKPQPLALTIVRFSSGFPRMDTDEEENDRLRVDKLVANAARELGGAFVPPVRLLEADGMFSAGRGWVTATEATAEDGIVMLAYVDLLFGESFLQRCRANTESGRRAYYPITFSTYNPRVVYGVFKRKVRSVVENYDSGRLHQPELGYWLDEDYGVSCQHLSDFRRFSDPFGGSVDHDLDIMLYERYVKSRVDVIRMPDPDLVQVHHRVTCFREMGKTEYNACLKAKAMNEASKLEWGLWVYKNLGDTDEIEKFLEVVNKFGFTVPPKESVIAPDNATKDTHA
ncbi:chondroitin sulfate N-acetylgalactosaminyltransferase 2-like [Amphibalanus amphitrite]|uniref:chondroitin sulfate N-acetylgalactosaminyltransferase 2-like n=1 Tax=Amphibalanus amphitrite TaxID=1232801 RepID=UPI001C90A9BA|nr:chondroitin sulfate N-acetylgalactosaminyltransferase 2-like [Amphibalanus amphitrite]